MTVGNIFSIERIALGPSKMSRNLKSLKCKIRKKINHLTSKTLKIVLIS